MGKARKWFVHREMIFISFNITFCNRFVVGFLSKPYTLKSRAIKYRYRNKLKPSFIERILLPNLFHTLFAQCCNAIALRPCAVHKRFDKVRNMHGKQGAPACHHPSGPCASCPTTPLSSLQLQRGNMMTYRVIVQTAGTPLINFVRSTAPSFWPLQGSRTFLFSRIYCALRCGVWRGWVKRKGMRRGGGVLGLVSGAQSIRFFGCFCFVSSEPNRRP